MLIQHNCDFCGKEFSIDLQRLKNTNICCSRECAFALKKAKKENNVVCYTCKTPFYIKPSHLKLRKHPDKVTCSLECGREVRRILMKGELNHQHGLKGELNSSFKTGVRISNYGYLLVHNPEHPEAMYNGYMFLHRLVMEEYLRTTEQYDFLKEINGRLVLSNEFVVHHRDSNKLNNTLANLEVLYRGEHTSIHKAEEYSSREVDSLGRLLPKGKLVEGNLVRQHTFDAGADVFSAETLVIKAGESALIATGLRIAIPAGYVGLLWSRSGLSSKYNLEVGAGCIDSGYTGEVKVHLYNHGINDYKINIGDRIAQLLTIEVNLHTYEKVDQFDEITTRGEGGFGSTNSTQDDLLGR